MVKFNEMFEYDLYEIDVPQSWEVSSYEDAVGGIGFLASFEIDRMGPGTSFLAYCAIQCGKELLVDMETCKAILRVSKEHEAAQSS